MKQLKFFETRLNCPICEDEESNLHHGKIETFDREEDAEKGTHVTINGSSVSIDNNISGNPSKRRDGIKMQVYCEQCDESSTLCIVQHKGLTLMGWEQ